MIKPLFQFNGCHVLNISYKDKQVHLNYQIFIQYRKQLRDVPDEKCRQFLCRRTDYRILNTEAGNHQFHHSFIVYGFEDLIPVSRQGCQFTACNACRSVHHVSSNKQMRKRGIRCVQAQDRMEQKEAEEKEVYRNLKMDN